MAVLSDDLLEEILVRVAPADLARASTACTSFHRVITDPIFLRRYRSLHPPLVLGLVNVGVNGDTSFDFEPAKAPHPAFARAADFSFDYIPPGRWGRGWYPDDFYDGRVLLECCYPGANGDCVLPDLAVCDPLSRRYLLLPPIPDGAVYEQTLDHYCVLFAPSVDEDDDEISFRVMMEMHCTQEFVVVVFSSSSGSWSLRASTSSPQKLCAPCDAYNCLYWKVARSNRSVKLNMNTEEFNTVDLPPGHEQRIVLIVEEGDGKMGMFSYHEHSRSSLARYYTSAQKEGKVVVAKSISNRPDLLVSQSIRARGNAHAAACLWARGGGRPLLARHHAAACLHEAYDCSHVLAEGVSTMDSEDEFDTFVSHPS